jgi:hypothetical protein
VLDTNLAWLDEDKLSAPHFSAPTQSLLTAAGNNPFHCTLVLLLGIHDEKYIGQRNGI